MSRKEERDALSGLLWGKKYPYGGRAGSFVHLDANAAHGVANTVMDAGYRRPRIITTVEELDTLPHESIVLTEQGGYWQADKRGHGEIWWMGPGNPRSRLSEDLTLPATVLWEQTA